MTLSDLSYAQIEQALQALPEPLPNHSHSRNSSSGSADYGGIYANSNGSNLGYNAWQGGYQLTEHEMQPQMEVQVKHEKPVVLSALLQQSLLTLTMQPQRRFAAELEQHADPAHAPRSSDLELHDYSEPSSPLNGQEQLHLQQQHFHFQQQQQHQQHQQQQLLQMQQQKEQQRELQWPEVACPMPLPPPSYEYSSKKRSLSSATHISNSSFDVGIEVAYPGNQQPVKQARALSEDAASSRTFGRRKACSFAGCSSSSRGNGLCKRHGGGKRCTAPMCRSSARSGSEFCSSHGGGRRCTMEGCGKGAEGSSFLCVTHGGGKRCTVEGCTKKDQGRGLCKGHGGGRRCTAAQCDKSAKAGTDLCNSHIGSYNLLGVLMQRSGAN
jgi:hypothetical protein